MTQQDENMAVSLRTRGWKVEPPYPLDSPFDDGLLGIETDADSIDAWLFAGVLILTAGVVALAFFVGWMLG